MHVRDSVDIKRVMTAVMIALVPSLLFGIYNIGYQHNLASNAGMEFWEMVWFESSKYSLSISFPI